MSSKSSLGSPGAGLWLLMALISTPSFATPQAPESAETSVQDPPAVIQDEIVVSANRLEAPVHTVGSSVTVISRKEIEGRRKTTVLELLRTVPGLHVVQSGGPGTIASVFIRGGNSSHTLVLLDGVRVNSNGAGAFDFADLATDGIERIEVLRGPQGTLYGSEAVAGVISIVSRRGEGPAAFWANAEGGSESLSRLSLGVRGGSAAIDYSVSVSDLSTDGISAASESAGNTEADAYDNLTVAGRFGTAFLGDGRADLTLHYRDGEVGVDGFDFLVGPVDDLNALQIRESLTVGLTLSKAVTPWWKQSLIVGAAREDLAGEDPDTPFQNFTIEERSTEITSQSDFTLSERDTLSLGYRVEKRQGINVGSFDEAVYLRSAFLQHAGAVGAGFHYTASVRNDDHERFGDETTYRFTGSLAVGDRGTRLHGTYGTGFKAPTFNELFFPFFGNPDLMPETSEGFDFGIEQTWLGGRLVADLTYFDTEFENLIGFDFTTFLAGNIAEATSDGFELTVRYQPSERYLLTASHTRMDSEDLATGLPLPRRPENRSVLTFDFQPAQRWNAHVALLVVSDLIDSDASPMDDYERMDLSLDYRWSERLKPYLRIENLFDEDYEEIPGFTSPGATAVVGLRFEL